MPSPSWDGARLFARIAQDLCDQPGVEATTGRIADLAKTMLGCDAAGVWRSNIRDTVHLVAPADDAIITALNAVVTSTGQGPALECLRLEQTVVVEDLATDSRWPDYFAAVDRAGLALLSIIAYPLRAEGVVHGALVLYSGQARFLTSEVVELGGVFASHAALALDLADTVAKAENLARALETNRHIGTAIGILMAEYKLSDDAAFDLMRATSQNTHRKIRDIADDVVLTGRLTDWRNAAS